MGELRVVRVRPERGKSKKRPGCRRSDNRALLVLLFEQGLADPDPLLRVLRVNLAFRPEAGGGRLRRPAGQTQVKPPRWLIEHMSYKDHLLPTKGHGTFDLKRQELRQIARTL